MNKTPITLEVIKQKALVEFASQVADDDNRFKVAPITRLRAKAMGGNPDAEPEDTVLIVAFYKDKCVGYHALLPGMLATGNAAAPVFWCSTFYVSPDMRRRGVARLMLDRIIQMGKEVVVTGATDAAMGAYLACGAKKLGTCRYHSVRPEKKLPKILVKAAITANGMYHPSMQTALRWPYEKMKKRLLRKIVSGVESTEPGVSIQAVSQIPAAFRSPPEKQPCFYRNARAINWMLTDRWLVSEEEAPGATRPPELARYHFTGIRQRFRYHAFLLEGSSDKGFFIFSVSANRRRTTVKLLDHYLPTDALRRVAAGRLLEAGYRENADRIDVSSEIAALYMESPQVAPMVKRKSRSYWIVSGASDGPLVRSSGRLHFELHDGEQAFT